MKNSLFILAFLLFLMQSCTWDKKDGDFILLKPGEYCQIGAMAVSGDTVFIAGSYILNYNPNISIQPVQSYIAAVQQNGAIIWEHVPEPIDYTRWTQLAIDGKGNIFAFGTTKAAFNAFVARVEKINSMYGIERKGMWVEDSLEHQLFDLRVTESGKLAYLRTKEMMGAGETCINQQVELFDGTAIYYRDFCIEGVYSCAKFINDSSYFAAWGSPAVTQHLYLISNSDLLKNLDVTKSMDGMMVNDVATSNNHPFLLATTQKNAQGPCLYQLDNSDSLSRITCMDYWPLHGSVLMKVLNNCTVLAFNATDATKGNFVQVVILNASNEITYEETIVAPERFVLSDMAVDQSKIYLAGILETDGEGSSMAVKIISIPANVTCSVVN